MKKVFLSIMFAAALAFAGCGNSEEKKQDDGTVPHDTTHGVSVMNNSAGKEGEIAYVCPCGGCPDVRESKPGKCPKCEMELVAEKK